MCWSVANLATLGGNGTVAGNVTVAAGGILLAGTGTSTAETLTLSGTTSLASNSVIELVLGASGAHSTLALAGGLLLPASLSFSFIDMEATAGTYDNILTGVANAGTITS